MTLRAVGGGAAGISKVVSCGIPFSMPASGSFGNNGALTVLSGQFPSEIPIGAGTGLYVYFNANAIAAGVVAGWYWTVLSGNTTGTVYNNTYTSGIPAVPTVLTPFVTTGPGAFAAQTGITTGPTISLPAGTMLANSMLRINYLITTNSSANGTGGQVQLGGQTVHTVTVNNVSNFGYAASLMVFARNSLTNQVAMSTTSQAGGTGLNAAQNINLTVNMAVAQNVTFQLTSAVNTETITLDAFSIEVLT